MDKRASLHVSWLTIAWLLDGVLGVLHCQVAHQQCLEDNACALLFDVIAKTCGDTYDGTVCRSSSLETCQGALNAVWANSFFGGGCVCNDDPSDADCIRLRDSLAAHPCLRIPRIDPSDRLTTEDYPTCTYAFHLCYNNGKCKKIYDYFRRMCKVKDGRCDTHYRSKCEKAWTKIQLTPVYGCLCHADLEIEKCAKIYNLVNTNPCIRDAPPELSTASLIYTDGAISFDSNATDSAETRTSVISALHGELVGLYAVHGHPNMIGSEDSKPTDVFPSTAIKAKSTCQRAYNICVEDFGCRVLLDNMLQACDTMRAPCNRTECMWAVRDFYHLGNPTTTRAIAFCICKYNDAACLIQQRQLHPPCAQRPEVEVPACHEVASVCKGSSDCRWRMERFVSACAVDQDTIQCRGPLEDCRLALIDVLGTPLRTNCACSGNDFSLLYSCIDWQRLVWLNPCVVQAQKDYHESRTTPTISPPPPPPPLPTRPPSQMSPADHRNRTPQPPTPVGTTTSHPKGTEKCVVTTGGSNTVQIPVSESQRIYHVDNPDCSMLCSCNIGAYVDCHHLGCPDKNPCHSLHAVYSHSFVTYRAFRGYCTCFSGSFICAKPAEGIDLNPGVYLFLGYSKQEEASVKSFTNMSVTNTVSFMQRMLEDQANVCHLAVFHQVSENLIVQVYLEKFNAERMYNNITAEMVLEEEEVCTPPLRNLTHLINGRHPAVHNHVVLSILKLAAVEVHPKKYERSSAVLSELPCTCMVLMLAVAALLRLLNLPP